MTERQGKQSQRGKAASSDPRVPDTHRLPDVRQRQPQREDDGDDEEVGEALAVGLGPGQAERLVLFLLVFSLRGQKAGEG